MIDYSVPKAIQEETRRKAVFNQDFVSNPKLVAALDVSYKKSKALSAVAVYNLESSEIVEAKATLVDVKAPYVPGYFFLREINPLVAVYGLVENKPDVVMINGHGYSHPRRAGIATYFGVLLSVPTIGVARKLLVGEEQCRNEWDDTCIVIDKGEVIGMSVRSHTEKLYVSSGHGVSLETSISIVKSIIERHGGSLYPMKIADLITKRCWANEQGGKR